MDNETIVKINFQVYAQFPYLKEIAPKVTPIDQGFSELRYQGSVLTANGMTLPIVVKVIVDEQGKIIKMVTSR